jgi:hypothetical protein
LEEERKRIVKTIRFYDMMMDCIENGIETTKAISAEFTVELPEDFDLNDSFSMLEEKTGYKDIFSFRHEEVV